MRFNHCFVEGCLPGDFMLNTALSTSQLRVLGTAILEWDIFSLDEGKRMETDGNKVKQSDFQDLSSIFHQSIKSKRLTLNTWSKRAL